MFTINAGARPVTANFINGIKNFNTGINQNTLTRMPAADVFVKSNVSFKGNEEAPKADIPSQEIGTDYTRQEVCELSQNLGRMFDEVWNSTSNIIASRGNIRSEKPECRLIETKMPENGWNLDGGKIAQYDWINNVLLIDKSYLPNMILVSNGNVAVVPQKIAGEFAQKSGLNPAEFKEIQKVELGDSIEKSKDSKSTFFMKLSPQDSAQLIAPAIAGAMAHVVATHLALNTYAVGAQAFKPFFDLMTEDKSLPSYGTRDWQETFPVKYVKENEGSFIFDNNDAVTIKGRGFNTTLGHQDLMKYLFESDEKEGENPLKLWASTISASYCSKQLLSLLDKEGLEPCDVDRYKLLYGLQLQHYDADVQSRVKATGADKNPIMF